MKIMTWIKLKTAIILGAVSLIIGETTHLAFAGTNETTAVLPNSAGTTTHETTVIGLFNLDDFKGAILECRDWFPHGNRWITGRYFIREGQSINDNAIKGAPVKIEIVRINSTNGMVDAREDGKDLVYRFRMEAETNDVQKAASLRLNDSSFNKVFDFYSAFSERTLLIHPAAQGKFPVAIAANPRNKAQAIQIFEGVLTEKGLVIIPDGNKFVQILPKELATNANPRSATLAIANAEEMAQPGLIYFANVQFEQVRDIYAKLINREILQAGNLPDIQLSFRNSGPLTKSEVLYALDVLLDWQGVKIVQVDEKISKVVWTNTAWINPKQPSSSPARLPGAPASSERHRPAPVLPGFK